MRIYAIGLDHRDCPVEVLERVAIAANGAPRLDALSESDHQRAAGWAVVSTCNRIEVYAHFEVHARRLSCKDAYSLISRFLSERAGISQAVFAPYIKRYGGRRAVEHLARVASGIESAVIGEPEILGQISTALADSERSGYASDVIRRIFRTAVRAGRRARAETRIGRGSASFATAIADLVTRESAGQTATSVVVVGRGAIGGQTLRVLEKRGVVTQIVTRTGEAEGTASGVHEYPFDELPRLLEDIDAVVLATSSATQILTVSLVEQAMRRRNGRGLQIIDAGMPRNADPAVAGIEGVTLLDLRSVRERMDGVVEQRRDAIADVERVIAGETDEFEKWRRRRESSAVIDELRRKAERIRTAEIERVVDRLPGLGADAREALEQVTVSVVRRLLHEPTRSLRTSKDRIRKQRSTAVRDLFALSMSDSNETKQ